MKNPAINVLALVCAAALAIGPGCGTVPAGDPAAEAALANTWTHQADPTHREVLALHADGTYVDDQEVLGTTGWTSTGEVLGEWYATATDLTRTPTETAPVPLTPPSATTEQYTLTPAVAGSGPVLVLNGVQFAAPTACTPHVVGVCDRACPNVVGGTTCLTPAGAALECEECAS